MHLTNLEKETIIVFNEAELEAEVFTYNGRMKRDLERLVNERPDIAKHTKSNGNGGETYIVPLVKVRTPRVMSDKQKAALIDARFASGNAAPASAKKHNSISTGNYYTPDILSDLDRNTVAGK